MKHFEEFEDFYTEYRAGLQWISPENESAIKAALMLAFNSGKKSGMLAAADIVGNLQKDYAHEVAINLALGYIERAREAAE